MQTFLLVVAGILALQLLVIIHEYGHFIVAKLKKVEVKEFGLGLPPRIFGKTLGRGIWRGFYSLNWLPLGGFVSLKGEYDSDRGPGTYGRLKLFDKAQILMAGVGANLLVAVILFTFLAWVGLPQLPFPEKLFPNEEQFTIASDAKVVDSRVWVAAVKDDSPASVAGLKAQDRIISLNGQSITTSAQLNQRIKQLAGQPATFEVERDGQKKIITAQLNDHHRAQQMVDGTQRGYLEIVSAELVLERSTWSAPLVGLGLTAQHVKLTVLGLYKLFHLWLIEDQPDEARKLVGGPIRVIHVLQQNASYGWQLAIMIVALISISLAVMNALPIPALDGGRLMLSLFFNKILRRPLTLRIEQTVIGFSFVSLIGLIILISIIDVQRIPLP